MTRALEAELRVIRYTRSIVLILAGVVAVAAIGALIDGSDELSGLLHTETVVLTLFVLCAGVVAGAEDYQHRTLQWTLLGTPNRWTAAGGKLLAAALVGAAVALAVLAVTLLVGAASGGLDVDVSVAELLGGQLALGALTACFGVACGMALRNLPAAVATVFVLALVLPLVFQAKESLAPIVRFLPYGEMSAAGLALGLSPASFGVQLDVGAAALIVLAWTVGICAIALARFTREDT